MNARCTKRRAWMDERRTDAKPVEAWVCRKGRGQRAFWVRPCPVSEIPHCDGNRIGFQVAVPGGEICDPTKAIEVGGNLATWNPEKLNCSRPIQERRNSEIHNAQGRQAQFRDAWRRRYRLAHLVTMIWWRVQHKELRPPCTDLVMPPMGSRVVARVLF